MLEAFVDEGLTSTSPEKYSSVTLDSYYPIS